MMKELIGGKYVHSLLHWYKKKFTKEAIKMHEKIEKAIELHNVYYKDGDVSIINGITGYLAKGKVTTLVGPSGAGKTTIFKLINGLLSPTEGEIYVNGENIQNIEPSQLRRNVGLALQQATMISGTVFDNLMLPKKLQGEEMSVEDANELLTLVSLDNKLLNRDVKDLSGGQKQKVSIARTLVNRPKILLLDEITSALDRVSKEEMEELIVRINQKFAVTIFWITHNLEQARTIGDDTWVVMDGKLIESGPSSLLDHPKNELVERFVKGEFA